MALNALYYATVGHLLGPAQYGEFATTLVVINLAIAPLGAVQMWASHMGMSGREILKSRWAGRVMTGSFLIMGLLLITGGMLTSYWHLRHYWLVVLIAVWFPLAVTGAILEGVRLGTSSYESVAVAQVVGNGLVRLVGGVAAVGIGLGAAGALTSILVGQLVTLLILVSRRNSLKSVPVVDNVPMTGLDAPFLSSQVVSLLGLGGLVAIDTLVARHLFSGIWAGRFAAAAIMADAALVVPIALVFIRHPEVTRFRLAKNQTRIDFAQSLKQALVTSITFSAFLVVFANPLLRIVFGPAYAPGATVLRLLALQAVGLALIQIMVNLQIARRSWSALWPWVGTLAVVVASETLSLTPSGLGVLMVVVTGFVGAGLLVPTFVGLTTAVSRGRSEFLDGVVLPRAEVDLTLVLPFLNPGPNFPGHVGECVDVLDSLGLTYEILAVSDGSNDGSVEALSARAFPRVRIIEHAMNQGKGAALRTGLIEGRGRYLGFIDADGDIPAQLLASFAESVRGDGPDIVYGSKRHPDSNVVYPLIRRVYSYGYQSLTATLFHLPVRDTQTGIKFVRREAVAAALPRMVEKKFAFDLELFVVCQKLGYDRFVELPVTIKERMTSTVSRRSATEMMLDTLAIFYRLKVLKYYDRRVGEVASRETTAEIVEVATEALPPQMRRSGHASLRILILNWRDLAHPGAGGAEVYTHAVAEELVRLGHRVTIFSAAVVGQPEREMVNGVSIVRRGTRYGVYRQARRFYQREGRGEYDVVIDEINTRPFNAVKWVKDARVVGLAHQVCRELWSFEMPWPVSWIGRHVLEPVWLRRYRETPVITVSRSSEESLREYGLRNVITIPNGRPAIVRRGEFDKESVPTVLFMGRLERHKRPLDALRAFEIFRQDVPAAQMWFIGAGSMEKRLREEASPNVKFFGHVSNSERNELISRSHVLVVTSIREGWGLVVTEAALLGTPAIGYDVPGLRDSISSAGGQLVEPTPENLAHVLTSTFAQWSTRVIPESTSAGVIPWSEVARSVMENCLEVEGGGVLANGASPVRRSLSRPGE